MFPFCNLFEKRFFALLQKFRNVMASIVIFLKVLNPNMTLKKSTHILSLTILRF